MSSATNKVVEAFDANPEPSSSSGHKKLLSSSNSKDQSTSSSNSGRKTRLLIRLKRDGRVKGIGHSPSWRKQHTIRSDSQTNSSFEEGNSITDSSNSQSHINDPQSHAIDPRDIKDNVLKLRAKVTTLEEILKSQPMPPVVHNEVPSTSAAATSVFENSNESIGFKVPSPKPIKHGPKSSSLRKNVLRSKSAPSPKYPSVQNDLFDEPPSSLKPGPSVIVTKPSESSENNLVCDENLSEDEVDSSNSSAFCKVCGVPCCPKRQHGQYVDGRSSSSSESSSKFFRGPWKRVLPFLPTCCVNCLSLFGKVYWRLIDWAFRPPPSNRDENGEGSSHLILHFFEALIR